MKKYKYLRLHQKYFDSITKALGVAVALEADGNKSEFIAKIIRQYLEENGYMAQVNSMKNKWHKLIR